MTTNTSTTHNKWIRQYPFVLIVLALAFILSYAIIAPAPTISQPVTSGAQTKTNLDRGWEAYTARYQAMAEAYEAEQASSSISVQRSRAAEIDRLNGMAAAYTAMEAARSQRSWEAYAARYAGLGKQFIASENTQRSWNAYAARYQAMADQFAAKEAANIQRGRDAYAARYSAMSERFGK